MTSRPALPLVHVVRPPRVPSAHPPLLVLLHGIGADERDLLPLAAHLDPRFLVVSLRAPNQAEPMGFAWYAIDWRTSPPRHDAAQAAASLDILVAFLAAAPAALGTDPARTFLFGFSQGAAMSLAAALARPELVRGAVLHSGRPLPGQPAPAGELAGLEVLVLHGRADPVLPPEHGRAIRDLLAPALGPRLVHRELDGAHEVTAETLGEAARWLSARLG
ncbi:phospholipase/Carboxylesterase [Anaeromyxobacter sp. K]|uniref:alpha/beta hydrolase n=1 Tax=Anaeromyxobacter sp. (strain K) TaxID=447217 RepID=UPI00015F9DE6|nr:alpha/beta fold hydrolase [Anaeromyxobacter sp. K]ACG71811.1 phospholipase/Carboxylesterase [Anaeromyxobacter sp. K]